jgi:repressor LexA
MGELKEQEKRILKVIEDYMTQHKYSPSMREIAKMANFSSTSTVFRHMENLRKKGVITWQMSRGRTIQILKPITNK